MFLVRNLKRRMKKASSEANINREVNRLKKDFKETCYRYADNGADFAVFTMYTRRPESDMTMERFINWVVDQGLDVKLDELNKDMIHVNWKEN